MSFLELARAAERRLWGSARKERKEDFSPSIRKARESHTHPPGERSGESEKSDRRLRESRYAYPWPDSIEGLGRRHIEAFTSCDNCGVGTWAYYGRWALCIRCVQLGRAR